MWRAGLSRWNGRWRGDGRGWRMNRPKRQLICHASCKHQLHRPQRCFQRRVVWYAYCFSSGDVFGKERDRGVMNLPSESSLATGPRFVRLGDVTA
jgi:hypothetical protein